MSLGRKRLIAGVESENYGAWCTALSVRWEGWKVLAVRAERDRGTWGRRVCFSKDPSIKWWLQKLLTYLGWRLINGCNWIGYKLIWLDGKWAFYLFSRYTCFLHVYCLILFLYVLNRMMWVIFLTWHLAWMLMRKSTYFTRRMR